MKKTYERPELEEVLFDTQNIMAASRIEQGDDDSWGET